MKDSSWNQHIKKKLTFEDRSRRTIADDCNEFVFGKIIEEFWKQYHEVKLSVFEDNLQRHLDYLFSHLFFARRES